MRKCHFWPERSGNDYSWHFLSAWKRKPQSTRTCRLDPCQSHKTRSARSSRMSAAWHLARFLAASFCSRTFVLYGLLSAIGYMFHGLQPFPQLSWSAAGIGIRIASPCAEEMFARRLARAITTCFLLQWSLCWQLHLESTRQFVLRMFQRLLAPRDMFNQSGITQHRRVTQWKQSDC